MRTLIKIDGGIQILISKNKKETTLLLEEFFKEKLITNTTHHKSLGLFNGMGNLSSKLIQFLENKVELEKDPSTIWVYGSESDIWYDHKIIVSKGESLALTTKEIKLVKANLLDFHIYGTIHNSYLIEVDGKPNILSKDIENFKVKFNEKYRDYEAKKEWPL